MTWTSGKTLYDEARHVRNMSQKQAIDNHKVRGCLYKSGVAELADAQDLKSCVQRTCGFDPHRHYLGEIAKWSNATDCKPVFRRFESDFRLHKKIMVTVA